MPCSLFVPIVRGSRQCAACHSNLESHGLDAVFVEARSIFSTPNTPNMDRKQPRMRVGLEASETSAFSPYTRPRSHHFTGDGFIPQTLIRPHPLVSAPLVPPQEDRSDSCVSKRIRSKRKERSNSASEIRQPSFEESSRSTGRSSPVLIEPLNDFKQILKRFQENSVIHDKRIQHPRRFITNKTKQISSPSTSPLHHSVEAWSPFKAWQSWSPIQKNNLNSTVRSNSSSRDTSARSRASMHSTESHGSALPTRETSLRYMPSSSLQPCRTPTPSSSEQGSIHSPLSHTGSSTEAAEVIFSPISLTSPKPKRRSSLNRWVKESDVDDPTIFYLSPVESAAEDSRTIKKDSTQPAVPTTTLANTNGMSANSAFRVNQFDSSCRKVLAGMGTNTPSNMLTSGSRSKVERSTTGFSTSSIRTLKSGSRATLHSIPFFMSSERGRNTARDSSNKISSEKQMIDNPDELYNLYRQMTLSNMQTLSMVADRLADDMRRGEEPISRNKIGQLEFSHFVITSPHPMLAKGKSLFYNALLPRPGNSDYLVTLMIASYSQYAPLMRRSSSRLFMLPGFLELEDIDGSVKKFLHDTGTPNLDGRHTKVIAMPRLNLCSFHTLAAHHSNERINSTAHEQLVSFILLQLLTALRMLQSDGVELLSTNFKEFLLAYRFAPDSQQEMLEFPRLIFLPETFGAEIESGGDEMVGLCRYAMRALCTLLRHRMDGKPPPIQLRSGYSRALLACATLLQEDKSSSLTKAKNVLEIALWGGEPCHTDVRARIWLDMARAECVDMMLRQLVCEPGCRLGASEHYQVEFLLSATPRSIVESHRAILAANI